MGPKDTLWFLNWTNDVDMRQNRGFLHTFCLLSNKEGQEFRQITLLLFAILSLEKNTAESILVPSLLPKIIKSHLARFALWYWLLLHPNAVKACSYTPIPLRSQTGWASQRVESPSKTMPITGLKRSLPGNVFPMTITPVSTANHNRLPTPRPNITSISAQRHPRQNMP